MVEIASARLQGQPARGSDHEETKHHQQSFFASFRDHGNHFPINAQNPHDEQPPPT
jgi:hypothetical protein